MILKKKKVNMKKLKVQIDKIINEQGNISYQIYYYNKDTNDFEIDYPFFNKLTKKQQKNHIESGNNLDEVIKQILEYNCELVAFYDDTQEVE
jgi:hypothetical protein